MGIFISVIVILAISFIMALRSLREEIKRIEQEVKKPHELRHGIELFIDRNF